jgi:hypothetical protein
MSQLNDLLSSLAGQPTFPGCRCKFRHHLFDEAAPGEDPETVSQRHAQALGLCQHCPALTRCHDWYWSLPPSKRPPGVVAGRVNSPTNERN